MANAVGLTLAVAQSTCCTDTAFVASCDLFQTSFVQMAGHLGNSVHLMTGMINDIFVAFSQ